MNARIPLALAACLALTPACASLRNDEPKPIDDSLVAELSESEMNEIRDLRSERERHQDDLARAQRELAGSETSVEAVRREVAAAEEEVEAEKIRLANAEKRGTTDAVEQAREGMEQAEGRLRAARNKLDWRRQEVVRHKARIELHEERLELSKARLELAKAEALESLDRPSTERIDLNAYRRAVREQQTQVELAEVRLNAADEEVSRMEASYKKSGDDARDDDMDDDD